MSDYITYEVKVYSDGTKHWFLNGELHREDGPAVEYADGAKYWYLNGVNYTEDEYNKKMAPDSCEGKIVEIEGKKYRLTEI